MMWTCTVQIVAHVEPIWKLFLLFIYVFFISFYTMNEKKNWFDFCYTSYCTISCNFFTFPVISSSRFSFTRLMMLYFKPSFRLLWCKFVSSSFLDSSCYDWSTLVGALILVTKTHIRKSTAKNELTLLHSMETKLHRKCDCNYFRDDDELRSGLPLQTSYIVYYTHDSYNTYTLYSS